MRSALVVLAAILLVQAGCLSRQVARDGVGVRQAILDLYTDQIMDNLIRAKNGLPFVQLAYSSLQVQDTDSLSGSAQNTYSNETDSMMNAVGVTTSVLRKIVTTPVFMGAARRDRVMAFKADPITDHNDVYEHYLAFAHNPALFCVSEQKPKCEVHMMRKCGKHYYWVPLEAAQAFQQLCLKTTFMRGPETVPPPVYWERTITNVTEYTRDAEDVKNKTPMIVYAAIQFDQTLPNAEGSLLITLSDGRKVVLPLKQYDKRVEGDKDPQPQRGMQTKWLRADWAPAKVGYDVENLRGLKVRVLLPDFPPPLQSGVSDLKKINDNLDQIRLNVVNIKGVSN
jgi:hypothetical protein